VRTPVVETPRARPRSSGPSPARLPAAPRQAPPSEPLPDDAPEISPDEIGIPPEAPVVDELPPVGQLTQRIPAEVRTALDELFRAQWTGVKRLRPEDLRN